MVAGVKRAGAHFHIIGLQNDATALVRRQKFCRVRMSPWNERKAKSCLARSFASDPYAAAGKLIAARAPVNEAGAP